MPITDTSDPSLRARTGRDFLVFDKASGSGIQIERGNPTFGFNDWLGNVTQLNVGGTRPTFATYQDAVKQFQFAVGKEEHFEFHILHDYAMGTDVFLHIHWSHIGTQVTGGSITFVYEGTYAKSHNQAAFPANISGTIVGAASSTQRQHILSEIQFSATTPDATQIDTDDIEPDGVILLTAGVQANNITVSGGGVPDPFIHYVDIHYQSTGIPTKNRTPDFYA